MKLLLTRHGETDWNLIHRYQGQSDIPLNQTGLRQVKQLAKRLASEKIDAIYSSDLSRAEDTAVEILKTQKKTIPLQKDPRWRELSFGKWEGLNHEEIQAQWHDEAAKWYADMVSLSPPSGESLLQLAERVQSALEELKSTHMEQTVLVVTHSGAIQTLLCILLGMDLKRYWQFRVLQASLTIVSFHEGNAALKLFNDTSHLDKTLPPPGAGYSETSEV